MAEDRALDWDSVVSYETKPPITILAPGEYHFFVQDATRQQHEAKAGAKMPSCPMAKLELMCSNGEQKAKVFCNLFLTEKTLWKAITFFKCVGLIPEDAKITGGLPWKEIIGCEGNCTVKNREYNGKTYNEVDRFLMPSEVTYVPAAQAPAPVQAAPAQAPAAQAPAQPQPAQTWGGFQS